MINSLFFGLAVVSLICCAGLAGGLAYAFGELKRTELQLTSLQKAMGSGSTPAGDLVDPTLGYLEKVTHRRPNQYKGPTRESRRLVERLGVLRFVEDRCCFAPGEIVASRDLYNAYRQYIRGEDQQPASRKVFGSIVGHLPQSAEIMPLKPDQALNLPHTSRLLKRLDGKVSRCVVGLALL